MSSAEGSNQQNFLQRVSTPLFLFLSLLLVPVATFVSVIVGIIVCVIAGVERCRPECGWNSMWRVLG